MSTPTNDNLVLVCGKSATGKSACLEGINDPKGVMYLNTENNKKLPFASGFNEYAITVPGEVLQGMDVAESRPEIHTIVVDSLTYLMDMYESMYVLPATNTMQAWSEFAQFFKNMMQVQVTRSTKNIIFTAHTVDTINDTEMVRETYVPIKGALKNQGIESYFSCVIATKKMPLNKLEKYKNDLLTINEDEDDIGMKYVFQTRLNKDTVNERLRGPRTMWSRDETFIDNDMQLVLDRLHTFYGAPANKQTA